MNFYDFMVNVNILKSLIFELLIIYFIITIKKIINYFYIR